MALLAEVIVVTRILLTTVMTSSGYGVIGLLPSYVSSVTPAADALTARQSLVTTSSILQSPAVEEITVSDNMLAPFFTTTTMSEYDTAEATSLADDANSSKVLYSTTRASLFSTDVTVSVTSLATYVTSSDNLSPNLGTFHDDAITSDDVSASDSTSARHNTNYLNIPSTAKKPEDVTTMPTSLAEDVASPKVVSSSLKKPQETVSIESTSLADDVVSSTVLSLKIPTRVEHVSTVSTSLADDDVNPKVLAISPKTPTVKNNVSDIIRWWQDIINTDLSDSLKLGEMNADLSFVKIQNVKANPIVMYTACVGIAVPGMIGNTLLFLMSCRKELRGRSFSLFLAAIAISDTLSLMFIYINMFLQAQGISLYLGNYSLVMCRVIGTLPKIISSISPWLLVAFSMDRYIAVVYPLRRKWYCTIRNSRIACVIVVLVTSLVQVPTAFTIERIIFQDQNLCAVLGDDPFTMYYSFFDIVFNTVFNLLLLYFLNFRSLFAIKQALKERMIMMEAEESSHTERETARRDREAEIRTGKITRALLSIPTFSFISMTPFAIINSCIVLLTSGFMSITLSNYFNFLLVSEVYTRLLFTLGYAANFWILLISSKQYRNITKKMLRISPE